VFGELQAFGKQNMDMRLKDKVAIVTGGARGIGAAFCEGLAAAGAEVVVSDVLDGNPVAERIGETQRPAIYVRTDVTSKKSVESLVADTVRKFGTVDILVNNAGLFADLHTKPFLDIDEAEWDRVMKVNVRGTFQCAKAVAPVMMEKKQGRIVNIASGTAFKGTPNLLHYVTSKGAVVSMTRSLARELGPHNICVNAIAPGLTMSEAVAVHPDWTGKASTAGIAARAIQREQVPADLLSTLIYLCSDESNFVTGQTISVDGGALMR
jgi:NAD(P)-dependent dehydrogenase (short-subunit alcohol dehydrogenase family)